MLLRAGLLGRPSRRYMSKLEPGAPMRFGRSVVSALCVLALVGLGTQIVLASPPGGGAEAARSRSLLGESHNARDVGGEQVWASSYGGPNGATDQARAIVASPDGSKVFVNGDSSTVAYATGSGQRLWARRDYQGRSEAVAVAPGGSRVFVTGLGSAGYVTAALDASTGRTLWWHRYDGPDHGTDWPSSVAASPGGSKVFVTGKSHGATGDWDYATVAYDAATGRMLWAQRYNGAGDSMDQAHAMSVSPGGSRVFVTGVSIQNAVCEFYDTVAYDASTGAQVWEARFCAHASDGAESMAVSPGGSTVAVAGGGYDTVAYDAATGAQLWDAQYPGASTKLAWSLVASPFGSSFFVTGYYAQDYATAAYDAATGTELWRVVYDGGHGLDTALSVAASPGGRKVFVSGYSSGPEIGYDYATLAYDAATGTTLWEARYAGPGPSNDTGQAVAAGPGGSKVFVTGWSDGGTGDTDYLTVAYRA